MATNVFCEVTVTFDHQIPISSVRFPPGVPELQNRVHGSDWSIWTDNLNTMLQATFIADKKRKLRL